MDRRGFLGCGALAGAGALAVGKDSIAGGPGQGSEATADAHGGPGGAIATPVEVPPFELDEVTLTELQKQMADGKRSSRQITEAYLGRIAALDRRGPELRSVIETNPEALEIAAALDASARPRARAGRSTASRCC